MSISYTIISLDALEVSKENPQYPNFVTRVSYTFERVDTELDITNSVNGSMFFDIANTSNFIPYENLTEDIIKGWIVDQADDLYSLRMLLDSDAAEIHRSRQKKVIAWGDDPNHEVTVPTFTEQELLDMAKAKKIIALGIWRYEQEISGVVINGNRFYTDREAQAQLTSVMVAMNQGLINSVEWKVGPGNFVSLSLTDVQAIATATANHVQMCFSTEKFWAEQIEALTTVAEVEALEFSMPNV